MVSKELQYNYRKRTVIYEISAFLCKLRSFSFFLFNEISGAWFSSSGCSPSQSFANAPHRRYLGFVCKNTLPKFLGMGVFACAAVSGGREAIGITFRCLLYKLPVFYKVCFVKFVSAGLCICCISVVYYIK